MSEPSIVRTNAEIASALRLVYDRCELLGTEPALIGTTRWVAPLAGKQVFVAWRWALVRANVVSIERPLEIQSNLYVVGERHVMRLGRLNVMVSELDWQAPVLEFIRTLPVTKHPLDKAAARTGRGARIIRRPPNE